MTEMIVVDAANVVGSRPDGWWRDRAGAAARLIEKIRAAVTAGRLHPPITVVLEGEARAGAQERISGGVRVVHAPGSGDDAIASLAARGHGYISGIESSLGVPNLPGVTVVTADRQLRRRVQSAGAAAMTPSAFLRNLD